MSGTRRSGRLKAIAPSTLLEAPNAAAEHEEEDVPDMPSNGQSSSHQASRKKRSAPTKKKDTPPAKKRRGAKLQKMPETPLDILFEIFSHLLPYDLLRLSRATKPLRQILMKRSSTFVWKSARANVPSLPDCPLGLSEPAYANLAFDPHCHFCGSAGVNNVAWALFKRACKACQITQYSSVSQKPQFTRAFSEDTLKTLCDDLGIASDGVITNIGVDCLPCIGSTYRYFLPQELKATIVEYEALEDEGQRAEWRKTKRVEKSERDAFGRAAFLWSIKTKWHRHDEIEDGKRRRSAAILDRLRQEGWGDVIDKLMRQEVIEFEQHALVKQNKDLTERIWKNIRPQMIELFETFRARQREEDILKIQMGRLKRFMKTFDDYCASLSFDTIMLPMGNIFAMDSVETIILSKPGDPMLDESSFQEIFSAIPELSASWKAEFDQRLRQLLAASAEDCLPMKTSPSTLDLATSLFRCNECHECHLTYKQVLSHTCIAWLPSLPHVSSYPPALMDYNPEIKRVLNMTSFALCPHQDSMKALLKACGFPEDATIDLLRGAHPLIECCINDCRHRKPQLGGHALYWHGLLSHCNVQAECIRVLNYSDLTGKVFKPMAVDYPTETPSAERSFYGCKYCYSPRAMSFVGLVDHLCAVHDIEIESRASMEHYVIHPAVLTHQLSYTLLYDQVPLSNV